MSKYPQDGVDVDIPVFVTDDNDNNLPIAKAQAIPAPIQVSAQPTLLQNSRSSRVVVQHDKAPTELSGDHIRILRDQGYPSGMIQAIQSNICSFPLRIWVVDNSGSMMAQDGHRIAETLVKEKVRLVKCSRFAEIQETVDYHASMAALLNAPTVFRLLNDPGRMAGPQQFSIAERGIEFLQQDLETCRSTMKRVYPTGVTPLAQHVREIRENVRSMQPDLQHEGTRVAIILATDGLPTDSAGYSNPAAKTELETALRSLEGLPVWVVIRLCTDDDAVVDYYNSLDSQLELSLEVLDDFLGEAKEVHEHNGWLNYALPLHRIREMGFNHRLFDLLDERKFTLDEVATFCKLLLGEEKFDPIPDPQVDLTGFLNNLSLLVHQEKKQWNPQTQKVEPWINMKRLQKAYYSRDGCSIM